VIINIAILICTGSILPNNQYNYHCFRNYDSLNPNISRPCMITHTRYEVRQASGGTRNLSYFQKCLRPWKLRISWGYVEGEELW
jgi:hypothetical protein